MLTHSTQMITYSLKTQISLILCSATLFLSSVELRGGDGKPVFLYSRYYNAEGEKRYLPDGSYSEILKQLRSEFEVRVHAERPTRKNLKDVDVILISNPSANPINGNPPPAKLEERDRQQLTRFIRRGGGVIIMGNQENHNLETEKVNQFLKQFGMQWTENYTNAKGLNIPKGTPVLGGLKWAYYTGNQIQLTETKKVEHWIVQNDLGQAPLKGKRDAKGILLAGASFGKGRLIVVTDSGWIINSVLAGKGLGGNVVENDDNLEIMKRLCRWGAGQPVMMD
jgi:hypothetical protein